MKAQRIIKAKIRSPRTETVFLFLLMMIGLSSCYYDNREELFVYVDSPPCEFTTISYTTDIVPILDQHCVSCHRPADQQGGVNLVGHNKAEKYARDGSLYGSVNHNAGYVPMPFGTQKLSQCDIQKLKAWIDSGAQNN